MKRQTNLFGFFQPVDKQSLTASAFTSATPTKTPEKQDERSKVEGVSIILDTPNALRIPGTYRSPQLFPSVTIDQSRDNAFQPTPLSQASTPHRRKSVHRRSSLIVHRQAELLEKRSKALIFDGGPPDESNLERANRQANASAKIWRGNYDALNYAPIDQVKVNCSTVGSESISSERKKFSRRSQILVAKALSSASQTRRPLSDVVDNSESEENTEKRLKCLIDSQAPPVNPKSITAKLYSTKGCPTIVPPTLNTEETNALNDIIDLLEEPTAPSSSNLTSRKLVKRISSSSLRAPLPTVSISAIDTTSSVKTTAHSSTSIENNNNLIIDDSFTQLNLSDWSVNEDPGDVDAPVETRIRLPADHRPLPFASWYRGRVTKLTKSNDRILLSLDLDSNDQYLVNPEFSSTAIEVVLTDSWADTEVHLGDTVNVVPGVGSFTKGKQITIGDKGEPQDTMRVGLEKHVPAAFIKHPDILVTGTKLVGSLYCTRRSILEQFWSSAEESANDPSAVRGADASTPHSSGYVMLMGSLLHELFQKLITSPTSMMADGKNFIESLLSRVDTILQAYACRITMEELRTALSDQLKTIFQWIKIHYRTEQFSHPSLNRSPLVHQVLDVEENVWSTRFGIKGKIDLSLLSWTPGYLSSVKEPVPSPNDCASLSLIPMELKTGRPTYSVEHKGQVLLYLLMLFDRYGPTYRALKEKNIEVAQFGWLVYLRDKLSISNADPGVIEPNVSSFRGLLQTRNRIADALERLTRIEPSTDAPQVSGGPLWTPELPSPINQLHTCQMCPVQLACSLLRENKIPTCDLSVPTVTSQSVHTVSQLLSVRRSHLAVNHLSFFLHWSYSVLLEFADADRLENVVGRIVTSQSGERSDVKATSPTFNRFRVVSTTRGTSDGQWITTLVSSSESTVEDVAEHAATSGDLVIVSSSNARHVGITLGTVLPSNEANELCNAIKEDQMERNKLLLSTDRPLPTWIDEFRLDRYVTSKGTQLNLSNLVGLMQDSDLSRYLRTLIVDRIKPRFANTLSKRVVQDIRSILKPMNACQRTAILRVLMANDYVLIQGYPGTGKTQTLVALLKVLALLNRKTLVVAHTHSAVDNLLGRLVESGEKRILRLGSPDRIRRDLLAYCFEHILAHPLLESDTRDPIDHCQKLIDDAVVVGCSALAASGGPDLRHAALSRARFDLVLIDEATQLLLPTSLGSLLCLNPIASDFGARFVLVGDPHQLPPLVQSSRARKAGFECSLFTHLLQATDQRSGSETADTTDPVLSAYGTIHKRSSLSEDRPWLVELNMQYRMNDAILLLANNLTYSNAMCAANVGISKASLADVLQPDDQHTNPPWLKRVCSPLLSDAALFLDTHLWNCCSVSSHSGSHLQNRTEAQLVHLVLSTLIRLGVQPSDIGVIAPHRKQVALIKRLLAGSGAVNRVVPKCLDSVEINTVDQFQGRDKRVIILSLTVCSGSPASCNSSEPMERRSGLLETLPRLTVALTRAKHKLIILGCPGGCHRSQSSHSADYVQSDTNGALGNLFALLRRTSALETLPIEDRAILES